MDWDIPNRTKRNRTSAEFRPIRSASNHAASEPSTASTQVQETKNQRPKRAAILISNEKLRKYLKIGGTGLAVILILFLGWQYIDAKRDVVKLSDPKTSAEKANQELVNELSKVAVLPTDENPQVAELTDKEKQKNNPFFADAQNGDKVLVYQKASKVIIYRPSTKQVVNIATLDAGQASPAP